ncbi:MAG: FAD:protein FMN transferase [Firmicutes bacterium]|nr:FAD:protein FMN transferase [Bacillota bacterium]
MKLQKIWCVLLILVTVLGVWLLQDYATIESARRDVLMMDTFVQLIADGRRANVVLDEVLAEMKRLEALLSAHAVGSDVYRINNAALTKVTVSQETIDVLLIAKDAFNRTGGAFDVTVGAVLKVWGFGTDDRRVPSAAELTEAMSGVGFGFVEFDAAEKWVRLNHPATRLDFGGVAKGYIVDRAVELIAARGVEHAVVDAGGDVRVRGGRPHTQRWRPARLARVGVQHPGDREKLIAVVKLMDGAVLTSGDYERYFIADGVRYTHIIDPRTGLPVRGLSSVTIVAPQAAVADAIATAVMVLGRDEGLALIEAWPEIEGLLITAGQEIIMSEGMAAMTELVKD